MICSLPSDIKTEIFSQLPVDSILQCKLVCKTWRTFIYDLLNDPSFIHIHTGRFLSPSLPTADDSSTSCSFLAREKCAERSGDDRLLVGSCNGLVCFINVCNGVPELNVYIGNPVMKNYVTLPRQFHPSPYREQQFPWLMTSFIAATGFGYHPCTKEYKFVRITIPYYIPGHGRMYVSVYTLGSGKWSIKEVEEDSCKLMFCTHEVGLLFNGALYWSQIHYSEYVKIISFDLEKEEFRRVPSPPHVSRENIDEIGVLGECFCVIRTKSDGLKDIWIMNLMGEKDYTWTKKFSIKAMVNHDIKPFALEKRFSLSYDYMKFASDDPKTASQLNQPFLIINNNTIMNSQMVDYWFEILLVSYMNSRFEMTPYMKSLVSLRALGENADVAAQRERKRKREGNTYIRLEDWLESISSRSQKHFPSVSLTCERSPVFHRFVGVRRSSKVVLEKNHLSRKYQSKTKQDKSRTRQVFFRTMSTWE